MLIGVVGLISSGKGTVADRLVEKHGFRKDSVCKKFKRCCKFHVQLGQRNARRQYRIKQSTGENSRMLSGVRNLAKT